jgi:hypothetical protein
MPERSNHDLLQASLNQSQPRKAPYSGQAGFLVSFFGGPLAACILGALSAQRIGRLQRDLPWLAAAMLAHLGLTWWALQTALGQQAMTALHDILGSSTGSLVHKLQGLLVFGLFSLLHRREQRAATLMGLDRPNGTWVGLGLIGLGIVFGVLLRRAMQ